MALDLIHVSDGVERPLELIRVVGGVEYVLELIGDEGNEPPPPPPPLPYIIGIYNGTSMPPDPDANTFSDFGVYPPIASSYYTSSNTINVSFQTDRINRGTRPLIAFSLRNNPTITWQNMADNTGPAQTWMDARIAELNTLAAVDSGIPVYFAFESEFEVKINQGVITGVSNSTYAQALDVFWTRIKANAPDITIVHWVGISDVSDISSIISQLTVAPHIISVDPYRNPGESSTATFAQQFGNLNSIKNAVNNNSNISGAGVLYACSETGTDRSHGDASVANYINSIPAGMDSLGLQWTLWFNRDSGPTNNSNITTGTMPLSVAALAALMGA